jgi:diguanylate cyclase (GGDEF)-like protein
MRDLVAKVMDARLLALLASWREEFRPHFTIDDPHRQFARHADHMLVIDMAGSSSRYSHYGQAFAERFGIDLTGRLIDAVSPEILPNEQRGMLEFEYAFARQVQCPLWRSYTGKFADGRIETWQRLVLPAGGERLVVGAYAVAGRPAGDADAGAALLRLLIERVPVVLDADGGVQDLALSLKAFSHARQHVAELEHLATSDPLTGVANLRHFHHLASLELDHCRRMGRAFSLLALDIDHFKRVNDGWGHAAGDAALQAFVEACRLALREHDILGRCGGEEFAVALPNTTGDGARTIAERLRRQVERTTVLLPEGNTIRLTVSVGVATLPRPDGPSRSDPRIDVPALMARADEALYRSKAAGRNRVSANLPAP